VGTLTTVEELLAEAQAEIDRLTPAEALAAAQAGDLSSTPARSSSAGATAASPVRPSSTATSSSGASILAASTATPTLARPERRIVLICDEGYQSSLAAATLRRFGLDACDVIDGVQGWRAAGLPLGDTAARSRAPR
jgi:rhodanese-related sulfurtransferase